MSSLPSSVQQPSEVQIATVQPNQTTPVSPVSQQGISTESSTLVLPAQTILTREQIEKLIEPSPYDNSVSFLYKQAARLGVPVRFLLIRPRDEAETKFVESFDLESGQNVVFITIFQFIHQLLSQDNTIPLSQLWDIISKFQGDTFNPLELVPIWLHSVPEFQVDNPAIFAQIHNFYQNLGEPQRFNNMTEVLEYYRNIWLPSYQQEYQRDLERLRKFVSAQHEIAGIEPVAHSDITLDSITIIYDYETEPGVNPLPDIFNVAKTSYVVPFIQYNIRPIKGQAKTLNRYYKIYKGRSVDARPNYNSVALTSAQASRGQTIYLNVWVGEEGDERDVQEEARTGKKESFNITTISYLEPRGPENPGVLRITIFAPHSELVDENTIINRVHQHLPSDKLPRPKPEMIKETRISGNFSIYGAELIEIILFHLIMNDPLFSSYLYLEEGVKSFAEKTRLNIHYRSTSTDITEVTSQGPGKSRTRSAVAAALNQQIIPAGEKVFVQQPNGREIENLVQQDLLSIQVKIIRANSKKSAEQFVNILSRLFRRYLEEGRNILAMYLNFVPEYNVVLQEKIQQRTAGEQVTPTVVRGRVIETTQASRVGELKKLAGDIFVPGYARVCQKPNQPKLIRPEEVPAWRQKYVNRGGILEERQILTFPKNQPRYILVCPDDRYPYPGVKENRVLSNREQYGFIPCCFKRNQETAHTSGLNRYRHGVTSLQARVGRSSHIIIGDKMLTPGRRGTVSTSVSSFLSQYDEDVGEIQRYGVPRSYNSFIHCVATALEDPNYIAAADKEDYVSRIRSELFEKGIRPEILRQELYDMTNEDIITATTDNDEFFDPLLYYKTMETLFDCNIYIFALNDKEHETGLKTSLLQLPRHKYFHVHPPIPGRPVVIIVRHWGSESNALEYPQCELIVDKRQSEIRMLFSESMNEILYPALGFVGRTLSWQIFDSTRKSKYPVLTCRMDIYSSMNYQTIFGQIPVIGQVIDTAGKARMFGLAPEWANVEHTSFSPLRIFVNVPPTAPLNVPEFHPEEASKELPPYQKLIELFGNPISATTSTDLQYLTGLWFPIGDIQFGFYCPCLNFNWQDFLRQHPDINQSSETAALTIYIPRETQALRSAKRSSIQRIRYLRRVAKFIDQIVKYLYLVNGRPDNIDLFLAKIAAMLVEEARGDSIDSYNISTLSRILPKGNDVESILAALAAQSPQLFPNNRVLIYDEQMYQGVKYQLTRFAKQISGLEISPSQLRELQDFYSNKEDFIFDPKSEFILSSLSEYDTWAQTYVLSSNLQQRTIQNLKSNIQTRLNVNAFAYQEPYIYQSSGNTILSSSYDPRSDRFYLIQNVAGGDIRRAIQVAYVWYLEKRNVGFFTEQWPGSQAIAQGIDPNSPVLPAHVVYRISPGGGIIVQQNNTNEQTKFLEILNYSNDLFAAMLPIL